jgi:hypothetical protein
VVQERLGHANIAMTLDTYGHLLKRGDDGKELAEAELRLICRRTRQGRDMPADPPTKTKDQSTSIGCVFRPKTRPSPPR